MNNLKTYEFYNGADTGDLMDEFLAWLSAKMGFKIGEYIGGGVEGSVYAIDKNRVIKLKYSNVSSEQYLSSRNVDGLVKIYQTGIIDAPKRFKYPNESTPKDYQYSGIDLLKHARTYGKYDTKMGYVIMERLNTSDELEKDLKYLDNGIWFEFTKGEFKTVTDENGYNKQVYELDDNDYHQETLDVIGDSKINGFGRFALSCIFKGIDKENFIKDFVKFISKTQDKKYLKIFNRLLVIARNVKKLNLEWDDVHNQQFAYNTKGEITALDVSFGLTQYVHDEKGKAHPQPNKDRDDAASKKVKNVIRESKIQKFFEHSKSVNTQDV